MSEKFIKNFNNLSDLLRKCYKFFYVLCKLPLTKWENVVNNIGVGREPLGFSVAKDSASHPTILEILILLEVYQVLIVALLICQS